MRDEEGLDRLAMVLPGRLLVNHDPSRLLGAHIAAIGVSEDARDDYEGEVGALAPAVAAEREDSKEGHKV